MRAIQQQVPLQKYNTLAIPVLAHYFVELRDEKHLPEYLAFAEKKHLPVLILGGGSNIVLTQDFVGLVIKMSLTGISVVEQGDAVIVTAAAGENWHDLVTWCLQQGYNGLENLALIPGSVGAAPIQNIGAYGVELTDIFESLSGWDCSSQEWKTLSREDCQFAYRDSIFKHALKNRFIITSVSLRLHLNGEVNVSYGALQQALQQTSQKTAAEPTNTPSAQQVADAVIAIRQSKLPDPSVLPNAGSFFKNPVVSAGQATQLLSRFPDMAHYPQADGKVKLAAGWLLEQAGWKGKQLGTVGMHQQQSLVLVNHDVERTNGESVLTLAGQIQQDVQRQFSVTLEIEPTIIDGQYLEQQ